MKKNSITLICLLILASTFVTNAQKKAFSSVEGGFSVNFPVKPKKSLKPMDTAFGKANMTTYEAATPSAFYSVNFVDFPTAIKDEDELNTRYDAGRNNILAKGGFNLIAEKIYNYKDYLGREFQLENAKFSLTTRVVVVEQRMFQLMVLTLGRMSKLPVKTKNVNQRLIDNFFNSFTVTILPDAKTQAVELPEDFGISIENSVFSSKFLGFSYEIPEGWTVLDDEQVDLIKEIGLQSAQTNRDYEDNSLEKAFEKTKFLLMAIDQPIESGKGEAFLMIAAERVSFPNFLPSAVSASYIKTYLDPTEKVVKNTTMTKIGGVDFAWIETFDSKDNTRHRMYVANRKGIALEIFFNYKTDAQLQILMRSLNSLKFEENQ